MSNNEDTELLARIDERVKHIEQMVTDFVRRHEFLPVQRIAFGIVALILSAVIAAVVAQVMK